MALLTAGLTWGIRPAIRYSLDRIVPAWSSLGATLCQLVIFLSGMFLIARAAGIYALLAVIAMAIFFTAGMIVGGENWVADQIATRRIRRGKLFAVGDVVTLGNPSHGNSSHGNAFHGTVTEISRTKTHINHPGVAMLLVRNSFVIRNPIVVHAQVNQQNADECIVSATTEPITEQNRPPTLAPAGPVSAGPVSDKRPMQDEIADAATLSALQETTRDRNFVKPSSGAVTEQPGEQSATSTAQQQPMQKHSIDSPLAAQLTNRAALGKRTIRELRKTG